MLFNSPGLTISINISLNFVINNSWTVSPSSTSSKDPLDPASTLPPELEDISSRSRNEIIAYAIIFLIGATWNLSVFCSVLFERKNLKWRITVLMLHLSVADLIVTFFLIPLEIIWRVTIQWEAGNFMCKMCQVGRAFGLYLSSNLVMCISLERFMAILFPLRRAGANNVIRIMIAIAYITAALCAAPQFLVFSVQHHPKYPSFQQCVSFGYFSNPTHEILYNLFSVSALFLIPVFVIALAYGTIAWKITSSPNPPPSLNQTVVLTQRTRRLKSKAGKSDGITANNFVQEKKRTLRMTVFIVSIFICCWAPYSFITLWYMFDKKGAKNLNVSIQDGLFIMACLNSCLNPIVYGTYVKKTTGSLCSSRWINKLLSRSNQRQISMFDQNKQQSTSDITFAI